MTKKFQINRSGFDELRNSPRVLEDLRRRAERVERSASATYEPQGWERNPGYVSGAEPGRTRARGHVTTGNAHAARHARANNTLLRALEAGRG